MEFSNVNNVSAIHQTNTPDMPIKDGKPESNKWLKYNPGLNYNNFVKLYFKLKINSMKLD